MVGRSGETFRMRDGYLRGSLARPATRRQMDVLAAFVAAGESDARSDLPCQVSLSAEHGARERPERPYESAVDSQWRARIGPGRVRIRCGCPRCSG